MKQIENLFYQYIIPLKEIYISLTCQSNYPNITWLDFAYFIQQLQIVDDKTPLAMIDRLFIQANFEETDMEENPDRQLCRFEFWETLVRIVASKFKDTKLEETYPEAFERLLLTHVLKYSQTLPWQSFREEELWSSPEVN